jgi:thiol-disulfide isomerase/thioredoxin
VDFVVVAGSGETWPEARRKEHIMIRLLRQLLLLIALGLTPGCARGGQPQTPEEWRQEAERVLREGTTFLFGFELPDIYGNLVRLSDYQGKVVILDLWGTWCPPCRQEVPHFIELYRKYHDKGLEILGVNFEMKPPSESARVVRDFVYQHRIPYRCLLGDQSVLQQVPDFAGFPTTIFLDRTGKVRAKVVGYRPLVFLESIVQLLLNEPARDDQPK